MAYSNKRRFVAGAVCPRCSEMDKLVVYTENGKDFRECVACGYKDEMRFKPMPRELDTRVNQDDTQRAADVQVINILPFEKPDT
jgi:uncharacterized metal-binding protein (TIGR02443 family)